MPVRDLGREMGITGASFYNTFDDKRSLYLSALDHNLRIACQIERLIQRPPQVAFGKFFGKIIERSSVWDPSRLT